MAPHSSPPRLVTIAVIGVSGNERLKGSQGVGKSLLCNRFIRGDHDDFHFEHSSILSQTDFSGSAVINNEHWLFWGEREIHHEDETTNIRLIEHSVFLDDVEFEPLAGPCTPESYSKRVVALKLESRDKLMYIQKEQFGQEAEFPQRILPDGKTSVDGFVFVFDVSSVSGRDLGKHIHAAQQILSHVVKTKRPIVIAASKFDSSSDEGRSLLQETLHSTHLRSHHFPIIETSALKRVNVDEVFLSVAQLVLKWKHRLKIQLFADAFRAVNLQALEARESYISILKGCVPVEEWPSRRPSFDRLLSEFSINRNLVYQRFVQIYGLLAARKLYERHVEEAREHWTKARLRALFPQLPRVFGNLLSRKELMSLTWSEANERIHQHPLFDEFFQPLGALSKQLEPISSPIESGYGTVGSMRGDNRIPAEILLRAEARATYEEFQQHVEQEQRRERLEEDFEALLASNSQICAGRSLAEVSLFLQGASSYEALAPAHAELVYNRYQGDLIKRAEVEFTECLLENIELFAELVRRSRFDRQPRGLSYLPTENELALVRTVLQDDTRYRQLSRLWELRDGMISTFCSFIAHSQPSLCVGRSRCLEMAPFDGLLSSFLGFEPNSLPIVSLNVHGKPQHVAQFITDLACFLHGEPFQSSCGLARIHCFSGTDDTPQDFAVTVYLLDGSTPSESISSNEHFPPILVAVADPSDGSDLLAITSTRREYG
ncbi:unnamed protein product, partial [Mesorhabditis belari]|uniref:Rho GTPase-activating protein 190 n=1 Tax=Mesorhabditis belari TaxID=2138241 RepID=A0AAF3FBN2_9BILA